MRGGTMSGGKRAVVGAAVDTSAVPVDGNGDDVGVASTGGLEAGGGVAEVGGVDGMPAGGVGAGDGNAVTVGAAVLARWRL